VLKTARAFKVAFAPAVSDGDGASKDEPLLNSSTAVRWRRTCRAGSICSNQQAWPSSYAINYEDAPGDEIGMPPTRQ